MRRPPAPRSHLMLITIFIFSLFAWFINSYSPNGNLQLLLFFTLWFISVYSLIFTIIMKFRLSLIISLGATVYLLLRFWHLTHPLYLILLLLTLISLELTLKNR